MSAEYAIWATERDEQPKLRGAFAVGFGVGWCGVAGWPVGLYLLGGYGVELLPLLAYVAVGFAVSLWGYRRT